MSTENEIKPKIDTITDGAKKILDILYSAYIDNRKFVELPYAKYSKDNINYLWDKEYIQQVTRNENISGAYKITPKGINFIRNNYIEISSTNN